MLASDKHQVVSRWGRGHGSKPTRKRRLHKLCMNTSNACHLSHTRLPNPHLPWLEGDIVLRLTLPTCLPQEHNYEAVTGKTELNVCTSTEKWALVSPHDAPGLVTPSYTESAHTKVPNYTRLLWQNSFVHKCTKPSQNTLKHKPWPTKEMGVFGDSSMQMLYLIHPNRYQRQKSTISFHKPILPATWWHYC